MTLKEVSPQKVLAEVAAAIPAENSSERRHHREPRGGLLAVPARRREGLRSPRLVLGHDRRKNHRRVLAHQVQRSAATRLAWKTHAKGVFTTSRTRPRAGGMTGRQTSWADKASLMIGSHSA
jgi:hypothetical protein